MYLRRLLAIGVLVLMGGILAACGSEDEEAEPTTAPATRITSDEVGEIEPTEAAEEAATETATDEAVASPAASPAASPVASPVSAVATADVVVSPEAEEASPEAEAVAPIAGAEEESSPDATDVPMTAISGTLTLDGRVQQDYTLSEEGCVGLGEWRQLEPGTQVIVRDASGTVVDVSTLEGQGSEDVCAWSFEIEVPSADYFSVSIPMVTEVWFDQNDPAVESGELELFVP